jgi:hypothetical protein
MLLKCVLLLGWIDSVSPRTANSSVSCHSALDLKSVCKHVTSTACTNMMIDQGMYYSISIVIMQELADLLRDLPGKTRVNLLPYNDTGHPTFKPSTTEAITVSTVNSSYERYLCFCTAIGTIQCHC